MNKLEQFELLASAARRERVPRLDVTARVLARIRPAEARRAGRLPLEEVPLLAVSGLSVLAATIVVVLAVDAWAPLVDPLAGLFTPLMMVMP
jgi:hypothetical protein